MKIFELWVRRRLRVCLPVQVARPFQVASRHGHGPGGSGQLEPVLTASCTRKDYDPKLRHRWLWHSWDARVRLSLRRGTRPQCIQNRTRDGLVSCKLYNPEKHLKNPAMLWRVLCIEHDAARDGYNAKGEFRNIRTLQLCRGKCNHLFKKLLYSWI